MTDDHRALIETTRAEHRESQCRPGVTGTVPTLKRCMHCCSIWPCLTVRLAEALDGLGRQAGEHQAAYEDLVQRSNAALALANAALALANAALAPADHLQQASDEIRELSADRDAVLARAEAAEAERDEARAEQASANARAAGWPVDVETVIAQRDALTRDLEAARNALRDIAHDDLSACCHGKFAAAALAPAQEAPCEPV